MSSFGTDRSTIWRLAAASALAGAQSTAIFATGAVMGAELAPDPSLATLPVSIFIAGMAGSTLPAGHVTARHGRRATYILGTGIGILSGLIGAAAIMLSSFVNRLATLPPDRRPILTPTLAAGQALIMRGS